MRLGDRTIGYSVLRGSSRRYTYFRFRPDMTLEVILPRSGRIDVDHLIKNRSDWVVKELDRLAGTMSVLTRDSMMVGGTQLRITFSTDSYERLEVDPSAREVRITAPSRSVVVELARRFYLKESSAYVVRRVAEFAPLMGVRPNRVDVREIGKWGYCTRTKRLSFSWQLAALNDRLKDYVVLHELAHLIHFDHSRSFKRALGKFCPDFKDRERELDMVVPYDRLRPPA